MIGRASSVGGLFSVLLMETFYYFALLYYVLFFSLLIHLSRLNCLILPSVVRFNFLTAARMNIRAFWDISVCSLVGVIMALIMEAVRTSETSVYSKETTWRYIPEGSNLLTLFYLFVVCLKTLSQLLRLYSVE
jgi:hypothetical protein